MRFGLTAIEFVPARGVRRFLRHRWFPDAAIWQLGPTFRRRIDLYVHMYPGSACTVIDMQERLADCIVLGAGGEPGTPYLRLSLTSQLLGYPPRLA